MRGVKLSDERVRSSFGKLKGHAERSRPECGLFLLVLIAFFAYGRLVRRTGAVFSGFTFA